MKAHIFIALSGLVAACPMRGADAQPAANGPIQYAALSPQEQDTPAPRGGGDAAVPDLSKLLSPRESEMRIVIQRYEADRGNLNRFYATPGNGGGGRGNQSRGTELVLPAQYARLKRFYTQWLVAAQKIDPNMLTPGARADVPKLVEEIKGDLDKLETQQKLQAEVASAIPFAMIIEKLDDMRRGMEKPDPTNSALVLDDLKKVIDHTRQTVETGMASVKPVTITLDRSKAGRAADSVASLRGSLKAWYGFYYDYDPLFTWWMAQPYKQADAALGDYATFLREKASDADSGGDKASASGKIFEMVLPMPLQLESELAKAAEPMKAPAWQANKASDVPDLNEMLSFPQSEMRGVIQAFQGNGGGGRGGRRGGGGANAGGRGTAAATAADGGDASAGGGGGGRGGAGRGGSKKYYDDWLAALAKLDFNAMSRNAQVDYLLLKNRIEYSRNRLEVAGKTPQELTQFLPSETAVAELTDKTSASDASAALTGLKKEIDGLRQTAESKVKVYPVCGAAAGRSMSSTQTKLKTWFDGNQNGGEKWPEATAQAYQAVDKALGDYALFLHDASGVGAQHDGPDIVGRPIGREAMLVELQGEMISYTPEELLALAEQEYAWCEAEMKKASRKMGYGDDWLKAVEKVKSLHVEPGDQPYLIRDLAWEAIDYLDAHSLISVSQVARETWGMEMMSPERQLVNPFFTGGNLISVSYPTSTMSTESKIQSMRGNNDHFARATVFHELIPGHNLQGYTQARYNGYRRSFNTAFWGEGWAVYWEMLMYERGFPKTPENRVGMLFWRMHRAARIMFSLNFHLGKWMPQECIDFLVDHVGHERENATAEVRRSFGTGYGPLYQAAYMLGAIQLRELHKEVVGSGQMTDRQFHDAVIRNGSMPITMVRASVTKEKLTPDFKYDWNFYKFEPGKAPAHPQTASMQSSDMTK